jgi:PAS domain S-box-containing protein
MKIGVLYWAGAGLLLPVIPWLGNRLQRVERASLRTRFALLAGMTTALALVAASAFDTRKADQVLMTEALVHQQQLAASIAEDLSGYLFMCGSSVRVASCPENVDSSVLGANLAQRVARLRELLSRPEIGVYVLDSQGAAIVPPDPAVSPELIAGVLAQQGSGALRYMAEDRERLVGFAPVEGLDWRVVVEDSTLMSRAASEEEYDYQFMLLIIALASVTCALSAGPLVAPLRALSGAAERLASNSPIASFPDSRVSEVAHLSQAFAQLRVKLAARTVERERAEAALRETNRVLAALIHAAPVGVICLDLHGAIQEWNPEAERLFGWSRSEMLGRPLAGVFQDTADDSLRIAAVLAGASFSGVETRLPTRTGERVDVALWTAPVKRDDGEVEGLLLMLADFAERRRLDLERTRRLREEAQRAEAETLLRRLSFLADASRELSSSLDLEETVRGAAAIAVPDLADWCTLHLLDPSGTVETVARASADPSLDEVLSELQRRYPPARDGLSPGSQALRTGQPVLYSVVTADWLASTALDPEHQRILERLAPLSVMGVPLIARGRTIGAMTFASTAPERRYDARNLALVEALARRCALAIDNARLYRETQDAVRARDTFLSVASHELRGPLARLKAYTEVLLLARSQAGLDDALLERSLGSIQRATDRLTTITQDLLDVARVQAGDLPLRLSSLEFGRLVRGVVRGYIDRIGERHRLVVHVSPGRHMVSVDAQRFEQVLENLLDNAFKYSPDGGEVQVSVRSEGGGVLLQVRDEGIGLPADAADVIFEPFGRAANAERNGVPGMGLGLYICRGIVERHGGRMRAESPGEGKGTAVSVWLPGASR